MIIVIKLKNCAVLAYNELSKGSCTCPFNPLKIMGLSRDDDEDQIDRCECCGQPKESTWNDRVQEERRLREEKENESPPESTGNEPTWTGGGDFD